VIETFGLSRDGARVTLGVRERLWSLMTAERVAGLGSQVR
jgi:hypothetical protein